MAVGVAPDLAVDGTDVEARAAAKTVECFPQGAADLSRAPVVHQDQMELLRALELTGLPRAAHQRRVGRKLLPGRTARENREKDREVGHRGYDLLDSHE